MKTIIAYNYLFRSKIIQDDKVFMEEKRNELARSLALHEIQTFKAIMRHTVWRRLSESRCALMEEAAIYSTARTYEVCSTPQGGYHGSGFPGLVRFAVWVGEVAIPALALGRIRLRSSHSVRVCSEAWWEHKGNEIFFHDKKLIISFKRGNR
jgi:hypothetical protein